MKRPKEILNLSEKQKEIAYCILFLGVLLLLAFGDQIALHFIEKDPNKNNSVFGENDELNYKIDFLEELSIDQILDKLEKKETFLLLSSRYRCETCDLFLPILKEVKEMYDLPLYYINRDAIDTGSEEYQNWINKDSRLKEHLPYTPYMMYYKDGSLQEEFVGRVPKSELEDFIIREELLSQ